MSKLNLNRSHIAVLAGLSVMQPVTVNGLQTYLGQKRTGGCVPLEELVAMGAVQRYKYVPPQVVLTEAQKQGFEEAPKARLGKRPYLYRLMPAFEAAAAGLCDSMQLLERALRSPACEPLRDRQMQLFNGKSQVQS